MPASEELSNPGQDPQNLDLLNPGQDPLGEELHLLNQVSGKESQANLPQNLKRMIRNESDWETIRAKDRASRTIATWGGGAYHWSQEFRDEIKAEDESWGAKRIASERSAREVLMARGASPPRRASSANTSFLDETDEPHRDYGRMRKSESSHHLTVPVGTRKATWQESRT